MKISSSNLLVLHIYDQLQKKIMDGSSVVARHSRELYTEGSMLAKIILEQREEKEKGDSFNVDDRCGISIKLGSLAGYDCTKLRLDVIKKFDIHVLLWSSMQNYDHYGEYIRRSNLGSTFKLEEDCMLYEKNYFIKFYVCFNGVKMDGWKVELLCVVGRYKNNHLFPIAWVVVCLWRTNKFGSGFYINLNLGNEYTLMSNQHKYETLFWRTINVSTEMTFKPITKGGGVKPKYSGIPNRQIPKLVKSPL
ncbi:hypothetical protein LXL04_011705 [Taraxacum kok-saghyz]